MKKVLQEKILKVSEDLDKLLNQQYYEGFGSKHTGELIVFKREHLNDLMYCDEVIRNYQEIISDLNKEKNILDKIRKLFEEFF